MTRKRKSLMDRYKNPPERFHIPPDITLSVVGNSYFLEQDKGNGDAALIEIRRDQQVPLQIALGRASDVHMAVCVRLNEVGKLMSIEAQSIHANHPELRSQMPLRELAVRVSAEESAALVRLLDELETLEETMG